MSATFLLTALVIVVTPGTGALMTISAGLSRGRRASVITAIGCTLGIVPHLVAAVTGTAALLRASGVAFDVLKAAGLVYLAVMAVATWRDRRPIRVHDDEFPRSALRTVSSAVLANVLNPKLTIFFFAFLPQFVPRNPDRQVPAMLMLSAVFMGLTLVVFVAYGLLASAVRSNVVDRPMVVRRMRQMFALSFAGLGVKLATAAR